MRTACLRVADLPLAAELRASPELAGTTWVVASGSGPRDEVLSVSPEAGRQGVRPRTSVTHARAVCSTLRVRVASPALAEAARAALLDVALSFSPRAALAPRACGARACEAAVFFDASGLGSLFPSEQGLAAAVAARAARLGLTGVVALATSRSVALVAARSLDEPGACRALAPEHERAFLAPLPVDVLDPDDALAERLTHFGVHSVSDLLRLPRRALATRLGAEAQRLVDRALGREAELPLPAPESTRIAEWLDLEHPVDRLEPLAFVLRGLLSRLGERLETRQLACGELRLTLRLDGGGRDARRIAVAAPTLDLRVWLRLVCQALESRPPDGPVEGIGVETEGLPLRSDQLDLFRPAGPAPAVLGHTLAELEALCGAGQVGAPAVADSHHPDAIEVQRFQPTATGEAEEPDAPTPVLALRALRPPLPAEVRLAAGRPVWLRSAIANGRIVSVAGPWRTTGGWWSREQRFAFDHYDVQTSDGSVARLRLDHVRRCWTVDAVYD